MRLLIAGSRTLSPTHAGIDSAFCDFLFVKSEVTEVVSGGARGSDDAGESWAAANRIPVKRFPADWDKYGKSAGKRRNAQMADYADMAIVFWDGESNGATDMVTRMVLRQKPVRVVAMRKEK